jgi:hypothetical protein
VGKSCDHVPKNRDHKAGNSGSGSDNMLQLRHSPRDTREIRAMQESERQPGAGLMDPRRQT